ncbi:thiol reductant ABC exporter subunit CydC [Mycetocola tolaasinivorans]|uniref:Thiol reductant ABC exporter subunit CydC n=1 Tax=Mycetocola tolaasinivorans TaxID=76635 RepID=A0A3L7AAL6_9MICO|nr:thiol reductant ABC exporter subunit CydC [Mycetocola tolaasinivorans]RLP76850.1 thiol reductant ABC exporter subunit CydC [Mycetocola tolaasinivorans]
MSDTLNPAATATTSPTRTAVTTRDVLRAARPRGKYATGGLLAAIGSALSTVALMACSAYLITRASEMPPIMYLNMAIVGVRAFALGRAFFRYLDRLFSHEAAFRQLETVRVGLLERLLPIAPAGLARSRRGSLLSTLVSDVDEMQNLGLRVIQPLLTALGVSIVAVVGVAFLSPGAALGLALALILTFALSAWAISVVAARAERSLAPQRATLLDALVDYLGALDVLVAYGAEPAARARVDAADRALTNSLVKRASGTGIAAAAIALFTGVAIAIAMISAIPVLQEGGLSGPGLAVLALVPLAVFEVVANVPLALGAWRQVRSSAERIANATDAERVADVPAEVGLTELVPVADADLLTLSNVAIRHPGATEPALRIDALSIGAGESLLIEGPSGAGKTTLAHALVRFIDYSGSIRLQGVELSDLHPDTVRNEIGLCEQVPYLFDEDIRQNLLFAHDTATDRDLEVILDQVGLGDWMRERGGLSARVGERGALVSGGQAQRLALARALLHEFPVIVLDEPTASVEGDLATALIADLVNAARAHGRTVILISHADVAGDLFDRRLRIEAGALVSAR